jgi:hypothetical protein
VKELVVMMYASKRCPISVNTNGIKLAEMLRASMTKPANEQSSVGLFLNVAIFYIGNLHTWGLNSFGLKVNGRNGDCEVKDGLLSRVLEWLQNTDTIYSRMRG